MKWLAAIRGALLNNIMFISQINNSFTFNEKLWLLSITNRLDEGQQRVPGAVVIIEGVLQNSLLFARYEISARPWQPGQTQDPNYVGYLSHIKCFESSKQNRPFHCTESYTYPVSPSLCDAFSKQIRHIAFVLDNEMMIVNSAPPKIVLVKTTCINWCFNLFCEVKQHLSVDC